MKTIRETIMHEIECFLALSGMHESTFGVKSVNDGHLISKLRSGKNITIDKADRIKRFIASGGEAA